MKPPIANMRVSVKDRFACYAFAVCACLLAMPLSAQIKIACRATSEACLATSSDSQALALGNPRGDLHLEAPRAPLAAGA